MSAICSIYLRVDLVTVYLHKTVAYDYEDEMEKAKLALQRVAAPVALFIFAEMAYANRVSELVMFLPLNHVESIYMTRENGSMQLPIAFYKNQSLSLIRAYRVHVRNLLPIVRVTRAPRLLIELDSRDVDVNRSMQTLLDMDKISDLYITGYIHQFRGLDWRHQRKIVDVFMFDSYLVSEEDLRAIAASPTRIEVNDALMAARVYYYREMYAAVGAFASADRPGAPPGPVSRFLTKDGDHAVVMRMLEFLTGQ